MPIAALSFPQGRAVRRVRQHRRDPADDLRHHAAGGAGAAARCWRAGRAVLVAGQRVARAAAVARARRRRAPGSVAVAAGDADGGVRADDRRGACGLRLWRTRWRRLGLVPLAVGAVWALATPAPDLLVTGDGRHLAVRTAAAGWRCCATGPATIRATCWPRMAGSMASRCCWRSSPMRGAAAICASRISPRGRRTWRILATRSAYMVPIAELIAACRRRRYRRQRPRSAARCTPRWLKLDRRVLRRTGGVALTLGSGTVVTILNAGDRHPWRDPPLLERTSSSFRPRHDQFHGTVSAFRASRGRQK